MITLWLFLSFMIPELCKCSQRPCQTHVTSATASQPHRTLKHLFHVLCGQEGSEMTYPCFRELMSGSRASQMRGVFQGKKFRHNALCFPRRAMYSWWMRSDQEWIRTIPSCITLAFGNEQLLCQLGWYPFSPLVRTGSRPCQSEQRIPIMWLVQRWTHDSWQSIKEVSNFRSFVGTIGKREAPCLAYVKLGEYLICL